MEIDISRRVMGASAVCSTEGKVVDVDLSGLIRRLLLFDRYVLVSVRLAEFPLLVRSFGYEGLRDLLAAKLIEIRCECLQLGQMGQAEMFGDPRSMVKVCFDAECVLSFLMYCERKWWSDDETPPYLHLNRRPHKFLVVKKLVLKRWK